MPNLSPAAVANLLWVTWFTSWIAAAFWQNAVARRGPLRDELLYRLFLMPGYALLFVQPGGWAAGFAKPRLPEPTWLAWTFVGLVLAGFAWMWWARVHLGRMWNSNVSLKADHKLIRSGPYAITRHPIYTGLFLSTVATAALRPSIATAMGTVLIVIGLAIKLRREERLLMTTDLAPDYQLYRSEVPALLPFPRPA